MEGGNNEEKDKEKLVDELHNKAKLPSLRTYQGDVAEFIKSKNESVVSIVVKEKERKEERQEQEEKINPQLKEIRIEKERDNKRDSKGENMGGFQINITMVLLSLLLIGGGVIAFLYIFEYTSRAPSASATTPNEIVPYNSIVTLVNITNVSLGSELRRVDLQNGVSLVKVSDGNGTSFVKVSDFFNFLNISPSSTLLRALKDDYVLGVFEQAEQRSNFLVVTANDFGLAFSGMLEWEGTMERDLSFLNSEGVVMVYVWKDLIIKNKDTRALVDSAGKARLAYTFLDKDTILITTDTQTIGEMSALYATRSIVR